MAARRRPILTAHGAGPARALALAALAVAAAAALAGPARATPGQIHVVGAETVNMRAGPSTKDAIVGRLDRGDRVMEFERRGSWLRVRPMGRVGGEGWVHGRLLEPEARAPLPSEEESAAAPPPPVIIRETIIIKDDDGDDGLILRRGFLHKFHRDKHRKRRHGSKDPGSGAPDATPTRPRGRVPRSDMGGVGAEQWIEPRR